MKKDLLIFIDAHRRLLVPAVRYSVAGLDDNLDISSGIGVCASEVGFLDELIANASAVTVVQLMETEQRSRINPVTLLPRFTGVEWKDSIGKKFSPVKDGQWSYWIFRYTRRKVVTPRPRCLDGQGPMQFPAPTGNRTVLNYGMEAAS